MRLRYLLAFTIGFSAFLTAGCGDSGLSGTAAATNAGSVAVATPGKVGHVFIVMLENESESSSFASDSLAPYLATDMPAMGQFLQNYYATGHVSLDNYLSILSGQAPNTLTGDDCLDYLDWVGTTTPDANGQLTGTGCVFPSAVKTVADQLGSAGYTWKGYAEDMGNDLSRDGSATCSHPAINSQDHTQSAEATDNYATRHFPFMYFHSIIDDASTCAAHTVPLTALDADLAANTPQFVFITPNLCHDGHDAPCADGEPGGLTSINVFLKEWVPKITGSDAFKKDGLLIVTFDEASTSDATACCNEPSGNNTALPGLTGPGGGLVGAVLISPFIKPGTINVTPYNHYALLRSVEDVFGLPYLGYAGMSGLAGFGSDVYNQP